MALYQSVLATNRLLISFDLFLPFRQKSRTVEMVHARLSKEPLKNEVVVIFT